MPFDLEIRKETQKHRLSLKQLKLVTRGILKEIGFKQASLSLLLLSDRKIRTINKKFLNHDYATDVIAFGYEKPTKVRQMMRKGEPIMLGDIVISLDTAKREAKDQGHAFFYEVCFYLCHGILHLMGYDDKTKTQRQKMWKKQEAILDKLGV